MQGQSSLLSAGSVPAGWLVSKRAMATTYYGTTVAWNYGMAASLQQLDLAHNHLTGSLPADANLAFGVTAELVLDPMDAGFGLCGPIPSNILASVVSSDTCAKASQQSCNGTSGYPAAWRCACTMKSSGPSILPCMGSVGLLLSLGVSAVVLTPSLGCELPC